MARCRTRGMLGGMLACAYAEPDDARHPRLHGRPRAAARRRLYREGALPEVVTEGETDTETRAMAEEAVRAILEYRRDQGIAIPGTVSPTAFGIRT